MDGIFKGDDIKLVPYYPLLPRCQPLPYSRAIKRTKNDIKRAFGNKTLNWYYEVARLSPELQETLCMVCNDEGLFHANAALCETVKGKNGEILGIVKDASLWEFDSENNTVTLTVIDKVDRYTGKRLVKTKQNDEGYLEDFVCKASDSDVEAYQENAFGKVKTTFVIKPYGHITVKEHVVSLYYDQLTETFPGLNPEGWRKEDEHTRAIKEAVKARFLEENNPIVVNPLFAMLSKHPVLMGTATVLGGSAGAGLVLLFLAFTNPWLFAIAFIGLTLTGALLSDLVLVAIAAVISPKANRLNFSNMLDDPLQGSYTKAINLGLENAPVIADSPGGTPRRGSINSKESEIAITQSPVNNRSREEKEKKKDTQQSGNTVSFNMIDDGQGKEDKANPSFVPVARRLSFTNS